MQRKWHLGAGICGRHGTEDFSRTKGDTEYSIRILPLGGFCRMEGEAEDGASSSTSFLSKSVGARMAVMAAGPVMNFLLAFLMIFGLTCTTYTATPVIKEVLPDSAAAVSGLEVGDRIQKLTEKRFISMMNCSIHCSPTTGKA